MDRAQLMDRIDRAKRHTAEMAVASPGTYHQYGDWEEAKKSLQIAQRNLEKAEAAWLKLIGPALSDQHLREVATRKGLIPATPQGAHEMSHTEQLLREALEWVVRVHEDPTLSHERDFELWGPTAKAALSQPAQPAPAEGWEPLFILHCGQIDSSGEQDEWETEANGQQRVDDFCRLHPGQKIKLYPAPPASQEKPAPAVQAVPDDVIREVFMAHGFMIKEGQTDLKPYVYAAARALLARATAHPQPAQAEAVEHSVEVTLFNKFVELNEQNAARVIQLEDELERLTAAQAMPAPAPAQALPEVVGRLGVTNGRYTLAWRVPKLPDGAYILSASPAADEGSTK